MVAPVGHQILNCRSCPGEKLNFIQNDEGIVPVQGNSVYCGEIHKEGVKIIQVLFKKIPYLLACSVEVDENVGSILRPGKFFGNIAFSNPTGSVNKKGGFAGAFLFPAYHGVIYFSFHRHLPCFCFATVRHSQFMLKDIALFQD